MDSIHLFGFKLGCDVIIRYGKLSAMETWSEIETTGALMTLKPYLLPRAESLEELTNLFNDMLDSFSMY